MHEDIGHTLAKVTNGEIVACLKTAGAANKQHGEKNKRTRYKVATRQVLATLRDMARLVDEQK